MGEDLEFRDLYTFDVEEAKSFGIPVDDCRAIVLLFPLAESEEDHDESPMEAVEQGPFKVRFWRQSIENSCGLMALLHIILNDPTSQPASLISPLMSMSPVEGANFIESCCELAELHALYAAQGQSTLEEVDLENVAFHFVAIIADVDKDGVWWLDGRKAKPQHFPADGNFFKTACGMIHQRFLENNKSSNFSAAVLVKK